MSEQWHSDVSAVQPAPSADDAEVKRRVGGFLVDRALSLVALAPLMLGIGLIVRADIVGDRVPTTAIALIALGAALALAVAALQIFLLGRRGSTVGQRAAGYALLREQTGEPVGAATALAYRALMFLLFSATSVVGLIVLTVLATRNPRRRTFVDQALGMQSRVERQGAAFRRKATAAYGFGIVAYLAAFAIPVGFGIAHEAKTDSPVASAFVSFLVHAPCGRGDDVDNCTLVARSSPALDAFQTRVLVNGEVLAARCWVAGDLVRNGPDDAGSTNWVRTVRGDYVPASNLEFADKGSEIQHCPV